MKLKPIIIVGKEREVIFVQPPQKLVGVRACGVIVVDDFMPEDGSSVDIAKLNAWLDKIKLLVTP